MMVNSNDWFVAAKRHDGMCTAPELRLKKYAKRAIYFYDSNGNVLPS